MEEVCDRENLVRAWKRVRQNKGSPGVDGMTIDDAQSYLREHWPSIRSQLLEGTYQPKPVQAGATEIGPQLPARCGAIPSYKSSSSFKSIQKSTAPPLPRRNLAL